MLPRANVPLTQYALAFARVCSERRWCVMGVILKFWPMNFFETSMISSTDLSPLEYIGFQQLQDMHISKPGDFSELPSFTLASNLRGATTRFWSYVLSRFAFPGTWTCKRKKNDCSFQKLCRLSCISSVYVDSRRRCFSSLCAKVSFRLAGVTSQGEDNPVSFHVHNAKTI